MKARKMTKHRGRHKSRDIIDYSTLEDNQSFKPATVHKHISQDRHAMLGAAAKYALYTVIMILLALAKSGGGVSPFTLGFLMALVYCKQNPIILSLSYTVAMVVAAPTLMTLAVALVAPSVVLATWYIHKLLKRQVKMIHVNFYALIAQLPTILLLSPRGAAALISSIATLILSQVFTYSSSIFSYAMLVRGVKYRFAADELAGGLILLAAVGMGLFSLNIFGFQPYYLVSAVIIMLVMIVGRADAAIVAALALGLGAGVVTSNIMVAGGLILSACGAVIFINYNRYLALLGYILGDVLAGLFFNSYGLYSYKHIILVAVALLIIAIIPKGTIDKLKGVFNGFKDNINVRSVLTRNRRELNSRLNYMSGVFHEMGDILLGEKAINIDIRSAVTTISREVSSEYCYKCPNVKSCMRALGGDTAMVIHDLVMVAEQAGQVTVNQITPFLSSRCARVVGLLDAVNTKVNLYKLKLSRDKDINSGKVLMAEQMHAISAMFAGLATELKRPMTFDGERERSLMTRLGYINIICLDIMISISDKECSAILTVREGDSAKPQLMSTLSEVMGCVMEVNDISTSEHKGYVTMRCSDMPAYDLAIGLATMTMSGSNACGDTYCMTGLVGGRFIVALCDGMGTGEDAHYNSSATIGMIESFYKAGFDNNAILNMINKLLSTYNNDNFTCLDMGIFDLKRAICDFIKLGAVDGYIRRDNNIIKVESGALPLGIVEEATPKCERKLLLNGDIIIFITDGIMDTLGEELLQDIMLDYSGDDMQQLADRILRQATISGAKDDSTVIVMKMIDRRKVVR